MPISPYGHNDMGSDAEWAAYHARLRHEEADLKSMSDHTLLHVLWAKAVGTPDYDKQEWKELEKRFDHDKDVGGRIMSE